MAKIGCNPFVFRQTPESKFSHFEPTGSDDWRSVLEELVTRHIDDEELVQKLDAEGKKLKLRLPCVDDASVGRFFSGVIEVDETTALKSVFAVRERALEGEHPFIQTVAVGGRKLPARHVEVILYHCSIIPEDERTYIVPGTEDKCVVSDEWQIVSVNARATDEEEPLTPMAMARNEAKRLGLPEGEGGTAASYTPEQYVKSIVYWSRRAMRG
jgi:hypothetical protein